MVVERYLQCAKLFDHRIPDLAEMGLHVVLAMVPAGPHFALDLVVHLVDDIELPHDFLVLQLGCLLGRVDSDSRADLVIVVHEGLGGLLAFDDVEIDKLLPMERHLMLVLVVLPILVEVCAHQLREQLLATRPTSQRSVDEVEKASAEVPDNRTLDLAIFDAVFDIRVRVNDDGQKEVEQQRKDHQEVDDQVQAECDVET
mmetsp:Transcript_23278/g.67374  ORF Transcript_23278/g.67374 Transcript_23278/m.67374 type:complete len:200 (+) Transcript_23278:616-1215(+)